ncbi:MAG: helix-hairpin-helix domain-containing protein, partial [Anaerolineae bacterium]|nr:helix-hairpin-helix domain-containing protein [Anaerolineae bacterium]
VEATVATAFEPTPTDAPLPSPSPIPSPSPTPTPGQVRVYITGAGLNSDVYYVPEGRIIKDVRLAAGGLTLDADPEKINQALELRDQQQIHIPHVAEEDPLPPVQGGVTPSPTIPVASLADNSSPDTTVIVESQGLININTAPLDVLDTLPGIGPVIGQRIIDYREQIGGFQSIEQIIEVKGIGDVTFAKLQDKITIQ